MPESIDRTTLPAAFLPLAKSQSRIEHDRDDALVTEHLAQAIDDVERLTNACIFERETELEGDQLGDPVLAWATPVARTWLALPFNNVSALVVTDAIGVDVSTSYRIKQRDLGGVGTAWLQGPDVAPAAPILFAFTAGMGTIDEIAPALRRLILRRAAALYEFREAALPLTADDLAREPALWRPDL
jgi:uncharacterized phiE125 gp8 family phage protein